MKMARCSLWCFLLLAAALNDLSAATVYPVGRSAGREGGRREDGGSGGGTGGAGSRRSGRSVHPAPMVDTEQDRKNRELLDGVKGISVQVFEALVMRGGDPCAVVKDKLSKEKIEKSTCFNRAAACGNLGVVRWFIKHNPDRINFQQGDTRRWTPLFWAANRGCGHIVKALLAAGADPTMVDDSGRSAVEYTQNQTIREMLVATTACRSARRESVAASVFFIGDAAGSTGESMPVAPVNPMNDVIILAGTAQLAQPPLLPPQPPRLPIPNPPQRQALPLPTGPVVREPVAVAVEPEVGNEGADGAAQAVALQTVTQVLRAAIDKMIDGMVRGVQRGVRNVRENCVIL